MADAFDVVVVGSGPNGLAAAIAVELGDLETAREHVLALTLLEPDRPIHVRRLKAVDRALERRDQPDQ